MSYSIKDEPILTRVFDNIHIDDELESQNFENAKKIFARLPSPNNDIENNVGLVVGKIQSGKTGNIIALTAYVFNHGYRIAIMLLADTNTLLKQNAERIRKAFEDIDDVEVVVESKDGNFDQIKENDLNYLYKHDKKIIICCLKHFGRINNVCRIIQKTSYANDYSMIIDDEADDVSQNTARGKFSNGPGEEADRSSTNKSIHKLMKSLQKLAYLSVTASPEANVLLQTFQSLAPNYCVTLDPGRDYYDLCNFHDPDSGKIVEIHDFDKERFAEGTYIPESLYDAFCFFIAGILVRYKRGEPDGFKASFLIHTSKLIVDHKVLFRYFSEKVKAIEAGVNADNPRGREFLKDVKKHYAEFENPNEISIDDVSSIFEGMKLHCINSQSDEKDLKEAMKYMPFHVVLGGNMLDRGLTLDGLMVTYMTRESIIGQADTLLQRARWLGYKKGFFDLCRVYMTPLLKFQFEELIDHYESVWQFMTACSEVSANLKETDAVFIIDDRVLKVTSPSKVLATYSHLQANYTQRYFTRNEIYNKENLKLISEYENRNGSIVSYNKYQTHKIVKTNLVELLKILRRFHTSDLEHNYTLNDVINLLSKVDKPEEVVVELYRMRINEREERTTKDSSSCEIPTILQGSSAGKIVSDPDYYPGDRYLKSDNIIVELHHVILKNDVEGLYSKGDEIAMIAILFPTSFSNIGTVTRKELE